MCVLQPELSSDVISVVLDGVFGEAQRLRHLLRRSPIPDQEGNLYFSGGKAQSTRKECGYERRDDVMQVCFQNLNDQHLL